MNIISRFRARQFALSALALLAASFLAACGGGGDGGGSAGALSASGSEGEVAFVAPVVKTPSTTSPTDEAEEEILPSTIVSTVAPATYGASTESAQAFALLNAERQKCGFGLLRQSPELDTAARGHANWLIANNAMTHEQAQGTPRFTGVGPVDRAIAAGYVPGTVSDEISGLYHSGSTAGTGVFGVRALLALPYHQLGMLGSYRDVGMSMRGSDRMGTTHTFGPRSVQQFDLGIAAGDERQQPATDEVLTYPCNGTTGVFYEFTNETPNPVPGRDLFASPLGPSILVAVRSGQTLKISSATMKSRWGATPIRLRAPMTQDNDPNDVLQSHQALIIPDTSLIQSTEYVVKIAGTRNGRDFSRTITFSTGTGAAR